MKSLVASFAGLCFLACAAVATADEGGHKCNCDKGAAAQAPEKKEGDGVKTASLTETHAQVKGDEGGGKPKAEPAPAKKSPPPARKKVEEDPLLP